MADDQKARRVRSGQNVVAQLGADFDDVGGRQVHRVCVRARTVHRRLPVDPRRATGLERHAAEQLVFAVAYVKVSRAVVPVVHFVVQFGRIRLGAVLLQSLAPQSEALGDFFIIFLPKFRILSFINVVVLVYGFDLLFIITTSF